MSTEDCPPGEDPKVEHSGTEAVGTSLVRAVGDDGRLRRKRDLQKKNKTSQR